MNLTHFFVTKIQLLKDNIDPKLKEDPIARLKHSQTNNKSSFSIKCTNEKLLKGILHLKETGHFHPIPTKLLQLQKCCQDTLFLSLSLCRFAPLYKSEADLGTFG